MKTIQVNLYKYNELKEDAKEKAKNAIAEDIVNHNFDFLEEDMYEILRCNYNLSDITINYSLSYCQGDGVCFYSHSGLLSYTRMKNKSDDMNVFEKFIIEDKTFFNEKEKDMIMEYLNCDYNIKIVKSSSRYSHAYTCDYSSDDNVYCDMVNNVMDKLCKVLFDNVYLKICKELEEEGYNCYEVNEDDIKDYASDYDMYFYESGEVY